MDGRKGYTIADIERAELIDGEMFMMSPPMTVHQRILVKLIFEIETYIRKNKGNCEIVSPSSRKMDYVRKTALYQETGVRKYWIVDSKKEIVTIYETLLPKDDSIVFHGKIDKQSYLKYNL